MINVCGECHQALQTGDTTTLEDREFVFDTSLEAVAPVTYDHTSNPGYFDCFLCDEVSIGPTHYYTTTDHG